MRIRLFSEVTLFKYNVSTILSPIVGRENMGISRMRTDRGKSRYTVNKVPLTKFIIIRLRAPLVAGNKNAESNLCG